MKFEDLQKLNQSCYVVVKKRTITGGDDPSTDEDVVEITQVTPHEIKTMAEENPVKRILAFELRPLSIKNETVVINVEGDKL